jgi:predicted nucleotidyltransferase
MCGMHEAALREVVAAIRSRWTGVRVIYLFGSEALGRAHGASDVDIAVVAPRSLGGYERFVLREDLARGLGRDVDLVDLRVASEALKIEVIRSGTVLFQLSPPDRGFFECEALADYLKHRDRVAGHYEAIAARGVAYG